MSEKDGRCTTCEGSGICRQCMAPIGGFPVIDLSCLCQGTRTCVDCQGQGTYSHYTRVQEWRLAQALKGIGSSSDD